MGWQAPRLPRLGEVRWDRFLAALYREGYDFVLSIEHEDRAFEATKELLKHGSLIAGRARAARPLSTARPGAVALASGVAWLRGYLNEESVRQEGLEAPGLVLDLASRRARQRLERLERDPPSSARQGPATNPSTRNVCATSPFIPMTVFRYSLGEHARPVGPCEQHVVPLRQEANRRGRLGVGQRRARDVEELAALLVAEAAQRLEPLERALRSPARASCSTRRCRGATTARTPRGSAGGSPRAPRWGRARSGSSIATNRPSGRARQSAVSWWWRSARARARARQARRASRPVSPCSRSRCGERLRSS